MDVNLLSSISVWPEAMVETSRADGRGDPSEATLGKTKPVKENQINLAVGLRY